MSKSRHQRRSPKRAVATSVGGVAIVDGSVAPFGRSVSQPLPFNARRLEEAREHWLAANWTALSQIDREALERHPDRGQLAVIGAAAALQGGDHRLAGAHAERAAAWGCNRAFMASVLLASARHVLGRASIAAGRSDQAAQHFQASAFEPRLASEARRVARARLDEVARDLAARRDMAARQRKAGLRIENRSTPGWIVDLVARSLAANDLHDAVDAVLEQVLGGADDRIRFLLRLAEQLQLRGDPMTAVHFLSEAKALAQGAQKDLRLSLAKQLVVAGQPAIAMDLLVDDALGGATEASDDEALLRAVRASYQSVREADQARSEHGHEVLLAHLKLHLPKIQALSGGRRLQMVEIGTTRENVPGQGSTRKLAEFCRQHHIDFVTVDMDPHNTRMAQQMFASMQVEFEAIAMKGEDYLRQRQTPVDLVFLDAYDFDHGKHSELRQSRYLKYLGSRIDEEACHRMHQDCAESLVKLLSPHGVICFDDTWLDGGRWTAKGTLAMPYLLEQGFELIDARNRAALLQRAALTEPAA